MQPVDASPSLENYCQLARAVTQGQSSEEPRPRGRARKLVFDIEFAGAVSETEAQREFFVCGTELLASGADFVLIDAFSIAALVERAHGGGPGF